MLIIRFTALDETHPDLLQQPFIVPCVTDDFTITESAAWENYSTIAAGEFSVPAAGGVDARSLRAIDDMGMITVDWDAPWAAANIPQAEARAQLSAILRHRTPFHLEAFVNPDPGYTEVEMDAKLLAITRTLKSGTAAERFWSLSLEEWRAADVKRKAHAPSRGRNGTTLPTTRKLDANDTLNSLSRFYYGNYSGWRAIAEANGLRNWGPDTAIALSARFKVGSTFKIPAKPQTTSQRGSNLPLGTAR